MNGRDTLTAVAGIATVTMTKPFFWSSTYGRLTIFLLTNGSGEKDELRHRTIKIQFAFALKM